MIVEPPVDAGALHDTVAFALPAVALIPIGLLGTVIGVIDEDAVDAVEFPAPFVATTVNVYEVPLVSPVTVAEVVDDVAVKLPGDDVTVYEVMTDPPVDAGALHETVDCPFPADALTLVGLPGTVIGVTGEDATDASEFPILFTAITVNVYVDPLVRPVIVADAPEDVVVTLPGVVVIIYDVITELPLFMGGVHVRRTCWFPAIP